MTDSEYPIQGTPGSAQRKKKRGAYVPARTLYRPGTLGNLRDALFVVIPTVALVVCCLMWTATQRPPDFYGEVLKSLPAGERRQQLAAEIEQQGERIAAKRADEPAWNLEFTEDQINSWLAEKFTLRDWQGISSEVADPRVALAPGVIKLGFQYLPQHCVLSLELRPRLSGSREITLKISGVTAGQIPIPVSQLRLRSQGQVQNADSIIRWQFSPSDETIILSWDEGKAGLLDDWRELHLASKRLRIAGGHLVTDRKSTATAPETAQTNRPTVPEISVSAQTGSRP